MPGMVGASLLSGGAPQFTNGTDFLRAPSTLGINGNNKNMAGAGLFPQEGGAPTLGIGNGSGPNWAGAGFFAGGAPTLGAGNGTGKQWVGAMQMRPNNDSELLRSLQGLT